MTKKMYGVTEMWNQGKASGCLALPPRDKRDVNWRLWVPPDDSHHAPFEQARVRRWPPALASVYAFFLFYVTDIVTPCTHPAHSLLSY